MKRAILVLCLTAQFPFVALGFVYGVILAGFRGGMRATLTFANWLDK